MSVGSRGWPIELRPRRRGWLVRLGEGTISLFADADIAAITEYLDDVNRFASERLGRQIYEACYDLASFPDSFAFAPAVERLGIRRRIVGSYSIFYVLRSEDVLVLRVAHSARDYAKLFPD